MKTGEQDTRPNFLDATLRSGNSGSVPAATQLEETVDITSISLGLEAGDTLADRLNINYISNLNLRVMTLLLYDNGLLRASL